MPTIVSANVTSLLVLELLRTSISWPKVVYGPWPGIEDENNMHAHTIAVELQALLRIFDPKH
jgi:hypothetical protein